MEKISILHLIETGGWAGAERMLFSLVTSLDPNCFRSVVCTMLDGWLNEQFRQMGIETVVIPNEEGLAPGWIFKGVRLIKEKEISLVHSHEFGMNVYGTLSSQLAKVPIITTVHGKGYYGDKWRRRLAYRMAARHSFKMVAVSENIRRYLVDQIGISSERISTIHNGIDPKSFVSCEERSRIREEFGLRNGIPLIGSIGSLYPVKGHTYLLKAASRVIRVFPESQFWIVGAGGLLDELQGEVRSLNLERHVKFLGYREDIPSLLRAMDLFVLPSLSEGLPIVLLEAMAASKPIVTTDVGGIPEVITDGENGFLVSSRDSEKLAERILFVLEDKERAIRIGIAGQQRVLEDFSLGKMVQNYISLYENAFKFRELVKG